MLSSLNMYPASRIVSFGRTIVNRPHPANDHKNLNESFIERKNNPDKISILQIRAKDMGGYDYVYLHRTRQRPLPVLKDNQITNDRRYDITEGVHVLPIAKDEKNRDCVVLCFEKRPTTEGLFDVNITIPGGGIGDKKENNTIKKAAKGELKEEAGYKLGANGKLTTATPIVLAEKSISSSVVGYVIAEGIEKIPNFKLGEDDAERQIIAHKPKLVPLSEIDEKLEEWTKNGITFEDGKRRSCAVGTELYAALYFYRRHKEKNVKKV